jgi:2,3-bisphosphoglycerate-dependent phosphoglycerate mutase
MSTQSYGLTLAVLGTSQVPSVGTIPTVSTSRIRVVTLMRHGETDWNAEGIVQGQRDDAHLTPSGVEHAVQVGRELKNAVDAVVSSDLTRARSTAELVATACGVAVIGVDERLRERSFGDLEGRRLTELTPEVTGIREGTVVDDATRAPNGESLQELLARVTGWVHDLPALAPDGRLVVVTHGGTIRALRALAGGTSLLGTSWDRVANCSTWQVHLPIERDVPAPND